MQASGRVTVSRVFFFFVVVFLFFCSYIEYFKNLTLYPSHTYLAKAFKLTEYARNRFFLTVDTISTDIFS